MPPASSGASGWAARSATSSSSVRGAKKACRPARYSVPASGTSAADISTGARAALRAASTIGR